MSLNLWEQDVREIPAMWVPQKPRESHPMPNASPRAKMYSNLGGLLLLTHSPPHAEVVHQCRIVARTSHGAPPHRLPQPLARQPTQNARVPPCKTTCRGRYRSEEKTELPPATSLQEGLRAIRPPAHRFGALSRLLDPRRSPDLTPPTSQLGNNPAACHAKLSAACRLNGARMPHDHLLQQPGI